MVFDGGIGVWAYFCVQTPVPSYMPFLACHTGYAHKLPGEPKKWRIETIGMDDAESVEGLVSVKMKALPDTSPNETLTPATREGRF